MSRVSETILYIEDNLENRLLVKRILQSEGYQVLEAEDAVEGLQMAREHQPELIIVDIHLPKMDGYALTTQLRMEPRTRNLPIIAITADALGTARERSLASGCDGFLQKPIDVDQLPKQIRSFLHNE